MKRILIIDENVEILQLFQYFLSSEDLKSVDFFDSPKKAIKYIGMNKYKTIITDYYFSNEKIGAKNILKKAAENNIENRIILTSTSKEIDLKECFATFLTRKPITKKKFLFLCKM